VTHLIALSPPVSIIKPSVYTRSTFGFFVDEFEDVACAGLPVNDSWRVAGLPVSEGGRVSVVPVA
jgi:hypothetical protein